MSFQGINFANQRLLPSDDGRLYQNIFNDGALYGCAITYSGTKLTIAQGHLVIGGRQIEIESAEVLDVNQAVSGFAQIVIAIDLTKTATISTFNQISIEVRYAAAEDGFSTLTQTDINGSGSYYEAQLALLSLGTGGITGIVQDMPQAAFKGAAEGGGLNLHVVGGTTQPTNPAENTVWVNTDTEISGYSFSATQPENPAEGMVWFATGTASSAEMNVDKKNTLMLYPVNCKQYINGAWVSKSAKTYLNGAWEEWRIYLYKQGDECTNITGGWVGVQSQLGNSTYPKGTTTKNADNLYLAVNNQSSGFVTKNTIDVTKYKTLKAVITSSGTIYGAINLIQGTFYTDYTCHISNPTGQNAELSLDISAMSGEYKIHAGIWLYGGSASLTIHKIWLEP